MSQFSHPTHTIRSQVQAHKAAWLAALLTLIATGTVVLILAINDDSSSTSSSYVSQPALRTDGGPDETRRGRVRRLAPEHRLERERRGRRGRRR